MEGAFERAFNRTSEVFADAKKQIISSFDDEEVDLNDSMLTSSPYRRRFNGSDLNWVEGETYKHTPKTIEECAGACLMEMGLILQSGEMSSKGIHAYDACLLSQEERFRRSPNEIEVLSKIHEIVERSLPRQVTQNISISHFLIPATQLQNVIDLAKTQNFLQPPAAIPGKLYSTSTWMTPPAPAPESLEEFVSKVNANPHKIESLRKEAIEHLANIRAQVWAENKKTHRKGKIQIKNIVGARQSCVILFSCNDPMVKTRSLVLLLSIVEADPIFDPETCFGLINLLSTLSETQDVHLPITHQRLLMKTFVRVLEAILLHTSLKHLNATEQKTRDSIWDCIDTLEEFNVAKDPAIAFQCAYARELTKCLRTEIGQLEDWIRRLALIGSAALNLASIQSPSTDAEKSVVQALNKLKTAFTHIPYRLDWAKQLFNLTRLCHGTLDDFQVFHQQIVPIIENFRLKDPSEPGQLQYGIVTVLESVLKLSTNIEILQDACKLLYQYTKVDDESTQSRVIIALHELYHMKAHPLSKTAGVILHLLSIEGEKLYPEAKTRLEDSISTIKTRKLHKAYNLPIIRSILRRITGSRRWKDVGGQPLLGLLIVGLSSEQGNNPVFERLLLKLIEIQLIDRKAVDVYLNSPLHVAAWENSAEMIDFLRRRLEVNMNARDFQGKPPLHIAIKQGHELVVQALLPHSDLRVRNHQGNNAFHEAVIHARVETIRKMKEQDPSEINAMNQDGDTPLDIALRSENCQVVDALWTRREPGNITINHARVSQHVNMFTPLNVSSSKRSEVLVNYFIGLLQNFELPTVSSINILRMIYPDGLVVSCSDDFYQWHRWRLENWPSYRKSFENYPETLDMGNMMATPPFLGTLHQAIVESWSAQRTTEFIESKPLEILTTDSKANNGLHFTVRRQQLNQSSEALIQMDLDFKAPNHLSHTPLHIAVIHGNHDIAYRLLAIGANVNVLNCRGLTPLHFAAFLGNLPCTDLLCSHRELIQSQTEYGDSPLHLACGCPPKRFPGIFLEDAHFSGPYNSDDSLKVIYRLIQAGANPYDKDKQGNSLLHHAACYGKTEVIEFLTRTYPELSWVRNQQGLWPIESAMKFLKEFNPNKLYQVLGMPKEEFHRLGEEEQLVCIHNALENLHHRYHYQLPHREKLPYASLANFELYIKEIHQLHSNRVLTFIQAMNIEGLSQLAEQISAKSEGKSTLANLLAEANFTDLFNELIEQSPSSLWMQDATPKQQTAFHVAIVEHSAGIIAIYQSLTIPAESEWHPHTLRDKFGNTPLHQATLQRCYNSIEISPLALSCKNSDGRTPLHIAASRGDNDLLQVLIDNRSPAIETDSHGNTALMNAVRMGHFTTVNILINYCPEALLITNEDGDSPLAVSFFHGLEKIAFLLLKNKPDLERRNAFGETLYHHACRGGHIKILEICFGLPISMHNRDEHGESPLHTAAREGHSDLVKALLENDVKLGSTGKKKIIRITNHQNETALHCLARSRSLPKDYVETANLLIEAGGLKIIDATDLEKHTAIHLAAERAHSYFVGSIHHHRQGLTKFKSRLANLIRGVHPLTMTARGGSTPLHQAALSGHRMTCESIVESHQHTGLSSSDSEGFLPFHRAIQMGHFALALWLLDAKGKKRRTFQAEFRTCIGKSTLHLLLGHYPLDRHGYELLKLLVKNYPNLIFQRDNKKWSCIHVAASNGHGEDIFKILLGDINANAGNLMKLKNHKTGKEEGRQTAAELASLYGHTCTYLCLQNFTVDRMGRNSLI
jgi:ankyrin repeat protein